MARLIASPPGGSPPNEFEQLVLRTLKERLPDDYQLVANFVIKPANTHTAFEIDIVVLAPHAVYVIECKEWIGKITGDDTEWLINGRISKPNPMNLPDLKCKILKTHLGPAARHVQVAAVMVIHADSQVLVGGGWAGRLHTLNAVVKFLQNPAQVGVAGAPITGLHPTFIAAIQGSWGKRLRSPRRTIGSYRLKELIDAAPGREDWRVERALIDDPTPYRMRIWTVPPEASAEERKTRIDVIKRPTLAVQSIGAHPNLLRVQEFNELVEETGFYEVTAWSDYGTLHGFLRNQEQPLTVRERLEMAAGVAGALVAVHSKGVVHRNICPETILVGFDRKPLLADFDRAYVGESRTVFREVKHRNLAYVPPELADATNYDFGTESDAYALGVLIYELFVGKPPFPNPQAAFAAQGEPPTLPSKVVAGVGGNIDTLVLGLLETDDFHARPSATEALAVLEEALGSSRTGARVQGPATPRPVVLEPGSIIAGEYQIEALIGEGGFARVFKVQHLTQGKTWAMKVVKNAEDADLAIEEWKTGDKLPPHRNIAEIRWLATLPPPDNRPYVICEYVDGEDIVPWCKGKKIMPITEVRRIGLRLLDALEALHPDSARIAFLAGKTLRPQEVEELERLKKSGFLHRDIKPSNIMLDRWNEPKLIDFNIATPAHKIEGRPGSQGYWAPDRGLGRPSEDLFSLGVVLYELATGSHPFWNGDPGQGAPYRPEDLDPHSQISVEFADFLVKAVQPRHADRFHSATEMKQALAAIPSLHKPAPTAATSAAFDNFELDPDERGRPDYNPYVARLLTLYSQAKVSNSGTRGLDAIANLTYVETRLDTELAPAVLDGQFRLIIVTGNAGDGKTAFLQKLEGQFQPHVTDFWRFPEGNGSTWTHNGIVYSSNYDGSQDEDDKANDAVLADFFAPFKGKSIAGLGGNEARIIAINEGRLRDFLDHSRAGGEYEGLRHAVTGFFSEGHAPPEGLLLLNLNLRAVAAGKEKSLVERQLAAMLVPKIWAPCATCQHRARCPLIANAQTLSDPATGGAVRERVRRLFEVLHLRRQQHVTMRDLRSALSWLLLRDTNCEDVAKLLASENPTARLARLSYTQAFARDAEHDGDRLVKLLRDVDVGEVEAPELDRRLHAEPWTAVPWMVFESRSPYQEDVWRALVKETPGPQHSPDVGKVLTERRRLMRMLRRRAWFERRDEGWRQTLPYRALDALERAIAPATPADGLLARDELKGRIIEAISLLEGVRHPTVRTASICLRASRVKGASAWSFRLFEAGRFSLDVEQRLGAARFLEVEPDAVTLRATDPDIGRIELRLTLDLVEMLEMVRHGFRPNDNDMGGLFVNLRIFKNALLHLPYSAVLVTMDNEEFYEVAAYTTPQNQLALRIELKDTQVGGAS